VQDVVAKNEFDMLSKRLNKLVLKEQRMKEAYQEGIDTLDEYKENKHRLEDERFTLERQLDHYKADLFTESKQARSITKRIENVCCLLTDDRVDMQVKYHTAHFLINQITFSKQERALEIEYR